jgi:glutathione synthase/RimK-type ligase-like ATP-grasp enzyme
VLVDAERLRTADVVVSGERIALPDDSGALVDLRSGRGWLRRLAPEDWRDDVKPGGHDAVVRSAWLSALVTIARLADLQWLSPLDAMFAAEDKLTQQAACRALGIPIPAMVLVTRPERIPQELGEWVVVKPMAAGHFRDTTGTGRVVHATEMRRSDERLELLAGAPFLVQERITAKTHLRVVTVGQQGWVCALDATNRPLDWRADDSAHSSFETTSRPDVVAKALMLTQHLGLGYSSQDWVIDGRGNPFFLDLNPAGQWLFLPKDVTGAATGAIVRWLIGGQ